MRTTCPYQFNSFFQSQKKFRIVLPFSLMNSLLTSELHLYVSNFAQHKHVARLALSYHVSCLKERSSVRDYIIHCSMQRTLSVINNLLYFLLMFPDSSDVCNPSQPLQISANAVKRVGVLSVALLAPGPKRQEKRMSIEAITICTRLAPVTKLKAC